MPDNGSLPTEDALGAGGSVVAFTGDLTSAPPNNLPLELSSFVGREKELVEVEGLLARRRLLTLTGSGGSGKTRLALAAAAGLLEEYGDGVWLAELAPLSDPDLVAPAVASALGVREQPGLPLARTLSEDIGSKKVLLVLDNCEHLLEACAGLAEALLRSCRGLKLLATSREALGVAGEGVWPVPALSLPDPRRLPDVEGLSRYESVRLFAERAEAANPAFALTEGNAVAVAQICYRLDGIPLALELAAARAKALSAEQIASRLDDRFGLLTGGDRTALPHRRTLRAAMDWSHDLLPERERALFRRLSVFSGGFTLGAAEAVCAGGDLEQGEVLYLLAGLVDKSLVLAADRDGEARYRLLETVRQYGWEKLEESGEAERLGRRHAGYYLILAEEAEQGLGRQEARLEVLKTEHGNLRAALQWARDPEENEEPGGERAEWGLRLATAMAQGRFWNAYGPGEGRRWLERGLANSSASPTPLRAKALNEASWIAIFQGDYEQAVALLQKAMALFKELGDEPGAAISLVQLGRAVLHAGDHERVRTLSREAEALKEGLADQQAVSFLLLFMGTAALDEGDHDRTMALCEEGLALSRELGDTHRAAMCLTILGLTALERSDPDQAAALYEEDIRLLRGLEDKAGIAYGLQGMAGVAALRGQPTRVARLWGAAETLRRTIGQPVSSFDRAHPDYERLLAGARSRLGEDGWRAEWTAGGEMTPKEAIEYALEPPEEPPEGPSGPPEYPAGLSGREVEVLALAAAGMTNARIAEELFISPRTVNAHLGSVYRKVGVGSRAAAARFASEHGLL